MGRVLPASLAVLASIVLLLPAARAADAATITVDTGTDTLAGPSCSLRAAIMAANGDAAVAGCPAGAGADTIVLPAGRYGLAIPPFGADEESTGDLNANSNLTIAGAGAATTTVDGGGVDRVFAIGNGATVTIAGLTVTGGHALAGAPGGGSTSPNEPDAAGAPGRRGEDGGGILDEGVLTMNGDVVSGNRAGDGGRGAASPNGATGLEETHSGSEPCNGGASVGGAGGAGGAGGGIAVDDGYLTLESTRVTGNRAGDGGAGGAAGSGGDGIATGPCAGHLGGAPGGFTRGGAGGPGGGGGGIALNGALGALTATGCTISANAGGVGGAGGAGGPGGDGAEGNIVGGDGGAALGGAGGAGGAGGGLQAWVDEAVPIRLTGCEIAGNSTGAGGPGGPGAQGGLGGFSLAEPGGVGGVGGTANGGDAGAGGVGGGIALLEYTVATVADSTLAGNATGAGAGGGQAGAGGLGGFGEDLARESQGGAAVGGRGGAGGAGSAVFAEGLDPRPMTFVDDTIDANVGGAGGEGGHGGVSGLFEASSRGGDGGRAGGGALFFQFSSGETLVHDTVDANRVGAVGAGGPGGGPHSGNPNGPGAPGAQVAGGVVGPVTLTATIVFNDADGECEGGVLDGGHDLSAATSPCPGTIGDPMLGGLAANGGPTRTQALGAGSAAVGAIPFASALCAGADQRGVPLPSGAPCAIGAYQPVAPTATTGGATDVTTTTAGVAGLVTADAAAAAVHFDYGTGASYGASTAPQALGVGTAPVLVGAGLTGLQPGTTYHYRLVAVTADGTAEGADQTFTTTAAAAAAPPAAAPPSPFEGLTLRRQSVKLTGRGVARIKASCPGATVGGCAGTLELTTVAWPTRHAKTTRHAKKAHRRRIVRLGSRRFAVPAGHGATLAVKLGHGAVARVDRARGGRLRATAAATATDGSGQARKTSAMVTLHRHRARRGHRRHRSRAGLNRSVVRARPDS